MTPSINTLRWTTNQKAELTELRIGKVIRIERMVMSRESSYDEYEEDTMAWAFNINKGTYTLSYPSRSLWKGGRKISLSKSEKAKIACSRAHAIKKEFGYTWSESMVLGWAFVKEFLNNQY